MTRAPTPSSARRRSTAAIERLYVLWIVSSLLLVLLVITVTLFSTSKLRQQTQRISEQSRAIEELRDALADIRRELPRLRAAVRGAMPSRQEPSASSSKPLEPTPVAEEEPSEAPARAVVATGTEEDIAALLDNALRQNEAGTYELANRAVAEVALQQGLRNAGQTAWSGSTWVRLAVLARLLDRDAPAEMFALRAVAAGVPPHAYYEVSARKLLAEDQVAEAIVFARRLASGRPGDPVAALLLAETYQRNEDLATAADALSGLTDVSRLSLVDRLRLGCLFVVLEDWDRLGGLLGSMDNVPEAASAGVNYLRAVLAIQQGRLPEALAILDNLLADQPDDYELRTWRGVALLYANQFQAAREALAHTETHPGRPEAWYWRGIVELRAGDAEGAIAFFQHALAASQRFAPAWEALATIALNNGDLPSARQNLTNAISANPRRSSAHFLLAVVHAKASRASETADALRTAFQLDPALVETARQTEVIHNLFTQKELEALAGEQRTPRPATPD